MKKVGLLLLILLLLMSLVGIIYWITFSPVDSAGTNETFTVAPKAENTAIDRVIEAGYVRYPWALRFALSRIDDKTVEAGGYILSKRMTPWEIADVLTSEPTMKWITIPEGLRKEQIGERLAKTLGWPESELQQWNEVYTAMTYEYFEGVYFPDTYLIPVEESGLDVAKRMQNRFNEKMAPYFERFAAKNILWTTGINLASLLQREAAGSHDMPLIAGILWNRLEIGMRLQVDATVQYARGKIGDNWWGRPDPADIRNLDSPYNTYKYAGLPPHPIANPGIAAIEAVLNPEETDCLFYLHDPQQRIHCAVTYEEHLENIDQYLR